MLLNRSKLFCLLGIVSFPFFIQCDSVSSSETTADNELSQKDSIEEQHPIAKPSQSDHQKLPTWPLKPKIIEGKRLPYDEGPKDNSFVSFREDLYDAILEKDIIFLQSILHDDIKFSFGSENGKEDFLKTWNLSEAPENSNFWAEMEAILRLGGAFYDKNNNSFYAPYLFMLEDIDDPFTQSIVVGEKVRLRDKASSSGKIITLLNWDLVEFVHQEEQFEETIGGEKHFWQKVKTENDATGFVYGKYVRSPIDFRAGFTKYDEQWMMSLFIAGD